MDLASRRSVGDRHPTPARRWLLITCGDPEPTVETAHGDFARWFRRAIDPQIELDVVDIRTGTVTDAQLDGASAVVVSGSPHSAYEELPWLPGLHALVREVVGRRRLPYLGVCFGHQVLARAFGGEVARNPRGREMGTIRVALNPNGRSNALFAGLPPVFSVQATHCDTVVRPPPDATVLATSDKDDCQAFALHQAWGVQFHPEVTAEVLRGYVRARAERLRNEGFDPDAIHDSIEETDTGRRLLVNLAALSHPASAIGARVEAHASDAPPLARAR